MDTRQIPRQTYLPLAGYQRVPVNIPFLLLGKSKIPGDMTSRDYFRDETVLSMKISRKEELSFNLFKLKILSAMTTIKLYWFRAIFSS